MPDTTQTKDGDTSTNGDTSSEQDDERAAPRSPSESPREFQGQGLMTWLMTPGDNEAPARGFQAFSGVSYRLGCIGGLD